MTSFKRLLPEFGYYKEPADFYLEVRRLFEMHCPAYKTDEQLKRHPRDAAEFCDRVRSLMNLPLLPDEAILGALENARKIGKRRIATI